ncbi:hypothetical protein BCR44DRAFT_236934 [Catenaria anguillulae PL171]|uniref:Uncharacterized protein n=1 Tax=Catenaria anguillulae PL171 TaxID=765915 RepID=A0A1Y2H6X3_9FUNG|nr:hypothetical protein BCR44DRAFT_236934 [Catenaria anguillulae PL171]
MAQLNADWPRFIALVAKTPTPADTANQEGAAAFTAALTASGVANAADFSARAIAVLIQSENQFKTNAAAAQQEAQQEIGQLRQQVAALDLSLSQTRARLDRAQDDLSTINADLRDTNKNYQALLAQSVQTAAVAASTQAQGPTTTLPPTTAKPPTEKQSDFATKSLEKLPSFGESPVSIAASLRQHKALHEYIVDMPEYFKILSHARKPSGVLPGTHALNGMVLRWVPVCQGELGDGSGHAPGLESGSSSAGQ